MSPFYSRLYPPHAECSSFDLAAKAGLLTLASGLRIATLSGDTSSITPADVSTLLSSFQPTAAPGPSSSVPATPAKSADIFLSHLVPSSLTLISSKPLTPPASRSLEQVFSPQLDEPSKLVRSKYQFMSSAGKFWEREPFEWPIEEGSKVGEPKSYCRALSLGEMGNKDKERVRSAPGFRSRCVDTESRNHFYRCPVVLRILYHAESASLCTSYVHKVSIPPSATLRPRPRYPERERNERT